VADLGLDHLPHLPIAQEGYEFWDSCVRFASSYLKKYHTVEGSAEESHDDDEDLSHPHITHAGFGDFATEIEEWEVALRELLNLGPDHPHHGKFTLIELIAFCMYSVSAQHQAVGAIGFDTLWMCPPCTIPAKTPYESLPPKNVIYMAFLLSALTSGKMPMLSEEALYKAWPAKEVEDAVRQFKMDVQAISHDVAANNKNRSRNINCFDPMTFECSVSV